MSLLQIDKILYHDKAISTFLLSLYTLTSQAHIVTDFITIVQYHSKVKCIPTSFNLRNDSKTTSLGRFICLHDCCFPPRVDSLRF